MCSAWRVTCVASLCLVVAATRATSPPFYGTTRLTTTTTENAEETTVEAVEEVEPVEEVSTCSKETHNRTCCNENEFQCSDGHCIPLTQLCNNKLDCPDSTDEDGCLSVSCSSRVHFSCDQRCQNLAGNKSRCVCYMGYAYKRQDFRHSCQDINECEIGVHWCSQDCVNLNGTFSCSCKEGFVADEQGLPGVCKALDTNVEILYSSDTWIYGYSVKNHNVNTIVHSGRVDMMDYDPSKEMVYWSTRHRVARSYLPGEVTKATVGHPQAIGPSSIWHSKNSLAIDWTARNLYWISVDILNTERYQILVSKLDGRYVKTLIDDVMLATSLVVDPEHGKMYWSCSGDKAEIGGAWMNGMYRRHVISLPQGSHPTALVLDHMGGERLYWTDIKTNIIYSVFHDGTRPSAIIHLSKGQTPVAMDVFENNLYWVTSETRELVRQDKFGRGQLTPLVKNLINSTAVKVHHPRRVEVEIRKAALYCRNQCSHLCLHVPRGYSCSCPDGSKLLLLRGEILCDAEQEAELEDPLVCDCKDKDKVCNTTSQYHKCHCPGVHCFDGVTQSPENYVDQPDDDEGEELGGDWMEMEYEEQVSRLTTRVVVLLVSLSLVLLCLVLSFFKPRGAGDTNSTMDGRGERVGFSVMSDQPPYIQHGGSSIVKSSINRGSWEENLEDEDQTSGKQHSLTSSTQMLVH